MTEQATLSETLAIIGAGAIACGLAKLASGHGSQILLWARSDASAQRASARLNGNVTVTTDLSAVRDASFVVEAIAEDPDAKIGLFGRLDLRDDAILATTTSSLSVEELAAASGRPDRFAALHVFNPVTKMPLVELSFPEAASASTRARTHALCEALGKTVVEVPDVPGFIVNRLLFPFLFEAVELMEHTGLSPEEMDRCMTLGAGHPMGPLSLLDFVGLDVAVAIGEAIGRPAPHLVHVLVAEGKLGRKSGEGFLHYG